MASHLCRTQEILRIHRALPALFTRTQSTQTTPSAGKGVSPPGNFNSAIPPSPAGRQTTGDPNSSYSGSAGQQSFLSSPAGNVGAVALLSLALFAGYKKFFASDDDSKDKKGAKENQSEGSNRDEKKESSGGDQQKKSADDDQQNQSGGNDNQKGKK